MSKRLKKRFYDVVNYVKCDSEIRNRQKIVIFIAKIKQSTEDATLDQNF